MEVKSRIEDLKINALNLLIELTMQEYIDIAAKILDNNPFQRTRVKSSSTVYSLLKEDLKQGCIIPPIVLGLSKNLPGSNLIDKTDAQLLSIINGNHENLLILDGLQRTYTLFDLKKQASQDADDTTLSLLRSRFLRVEVYLGINKIGILYRMLTLNSGQTPMSLRHQIEILYSDYLNTPPKGITLLTENTGRSPESLGEYKFKDVIEGFDSYLERDELPIDKGDILDNIKSLEKLSKENKDTDLFSSFLKTYNSFVVKLDELFPRWSFESDMIDYKMSGTSFGSSVVKIFSKSQALTGFGSAIGKLIDFKTLGEFQDVLDKNSSLKRDSPEDLDQLIITLDRIRVHSKKIGNDQRLFFHFFFRELFNVNGDAYLKIGEAVKEGYKAFVRKTM